MTVRRDIAEPRRETSARSPEDPMRTRAVRSGSEGRARWPEARRSSGSAIVAEALMNNVGQVSICLSHAQLFIYFFEYPVTCCGDETEKNPIREFVRIDGDLDDQGNIAKAANRQLSLMS